MHIEGHLAQTFHRRKARGAAHVIYTRTPENGVEEDISCENGDQDEGESESDSEPDLEAIGPQPLRKEMAAYKAFLRREINRRHTCDPDL